MKTQDKNTIRLKALSENLKGLRNKKGWSIEELSQTSKISVKILRQIESGKDFDIDYLFKLCEIYGIELSEIFSLIE